jgi:hypothetical protein
MELRGRSSDTHTPEQVDNWAVLNILSTLVKSLISFAVASKHYEYVIHHKTQSESLSPNLTFPGLTIRLSLEEGLTHEGDEDTIVGGALVHPGHTTFIKP